MKLTNRMTRRLGPGTILGFVILFLSGPAFPGDRQAVSDRPGLPWVWFNSRAFSRPRDTGIAERPEVNTGTTFNDYSRIWLGLIEIPTDQPVTFSAEADNGLRLILNHTLVIDGLTRNSARRGTFQAEKGKRVPLRLEFIQNGDRASLQLFWEWPSHGREPIPASVFFHTADQKRQVEGFLQGRMVNEDRSMIFQPEDGIPGRALKSQWPVPAHPGPHLLIDDYLIAASSGVERAVIPPQRDATIPNPIITGPEDRNFQPFFTVLHDRENGGWRIWYEASREDEHRTRSLLATMESEDGIHFRRPHRICDTPEIQFGSEVIDRGKQHPDPMTRYVFSYWLDGGTRLFCSADGFQWQHLPQHRVLMHTNDIGGIDWDPLRKMYVATISHNLTGANWTGTRRTTMMSVSKDLSHWEDEWFVLTANNRLDDGETQFYAMDGYITRGALRIGMVKVLRDDLTATGTQPGSLGRAHTSLAWTRDGRTWVRDRARFFEPDDDPRAWDHAHAWIDEQVPVGDDVYLYYAGYRQGHKINRFRERQIGLLKMPLDRYVARRAQGPDPGRLTTVPIMLDPSTRELRVNVSANHGSLRVQIRNPETGNVLPGFRFEDCRTIVTDDLREPIQWQQGKLSDLAGNEVQVEFELTSADLFAFEFVR